MIYLDSSVALAQLLAEDRKPDDLFWERRLVSSRLLQYEIWNTLNARQFHYSHGDAARQLLERVAFVELTPAVLARALEPFPVQVRTLDSLHLASMEYLRGQAQKFALASYDKRLIIAARPLGIEPTEV